MQNYGLYRIHGLLNDYMTHPCNEKIWMWSGQCLDGMNGTPMQLDGLDGHSKDYMAHPCN